MSDAVKLTAGAITDPRFGDHLPFQITGVVQSTAGSIVLYDGTSASGVPVLASSAIGAITVNFAINIREGLFVVLTGGATGSVLTE